VSRWGGLAGGVLGSRWLSNQVADRLSGGLVRMMGEREVCITMSSREGMASIDDNAQPSCERGPRFGHSLVAPICRAWVNVQKVNV
jgi:hypothetical protein